MLGLSKVGHELRLREQGRCLQLMCLLCRHPPHSEDKVPVTPTKKERQIKAKVQQLKVPRL